MLKKNLISAALVALSSISAFADSESSFYLGVKGLYFTPKKEIHESFDYYVKGISSKVPIESKTKGIFLPGLQFGYNVSDSIRIGLAGYFGASKFKYEVDVNEAQLQHTMSALRALVVDRAPPAAVPATIFNDTAHATVADTAIRAIVDAADDSDSPSYRAVARGADLLCNRPLEVATFIKERALSPDLKGALSQEIAGIGFNYEELAALEQYENLYYENAKLELGPRFAVFATMDAKLFETDSFSLGLGFGAGAAKWKSSCSYDVTEDGGKRHESQDFSAWKPAFMGTVNANINLGDVAVLTGSAGYAHLGNPKGLKTSDDKGQTFDADANKAKGWVFGIGIGKEF